MKNHLDLMHYYVFSNGGMVEVTRWHVTVLAPNNSSTLSLWYLTVRKKIEPALTSVAIDIGFRR